MKEVYVRKAELDCRSLGRPLDLVSCPAAIIAALDGRSLY
jgi:hypothetical protein